MNIRVCVVSATVALSIGCFHVLPHDQTPPAGADSLLSLAKARWGNTVSIAPPATTGACAGSSGTVTGDLNGDGVADVAARLVTPDGTHLVAALARTEGSELIDVGKLDASTGALRVEPRGGPYLMPGLKMDFYFPSDTLAWSDCQATETAYVWDGVHFDTMSVMPDPAAAHTNSRASSATP